MARIEVSGIVRARDLMLSTTKEVHCGIVVAYAFLAETSVANSYFASGAILPRVVVEEVALATNPH